MGSGVEDFDSKDKEKLVIENFKQLEGNIDDEKLSEALCDLSYAGVRSEALIEIIETTCYENQDFHERLNKEVVSYLPRSNYYLAIDFVTSEELENHKATNLVKVSTRDELGGYYSTYEDEYIAPGKMDPIEKWTKKHYFGDFCLMTFSNEFVSEFLYRRMVRQVRILYFRDKVVYTEKDEFEAEVGSASWNFSFSSYGVDVYYDGEFIFWGNDIFKIED